MGRRCGKIGSRAIKVGPSSSSELCTNIKTQTDTIFHNISMYVLSDVLFSYLSIKDIGSIQKCCRSLMELIETACEVTAAMYVNRSNNGNVPLNVGSYLRRTPFSIPKPRHKSCLNLSIVCTLTCFETLLSQQREDTTHDYMTTVQSAHSLGPLQFLDEHMRASLVDWMAEVSVDFSFAPSILHCAVQLVDIVLSSLPVPRRRFQLLGCVALLIRSKEIHLEGDVLMSEMDVVRMCNSQYSLEEVQEMVSVIERHRGNQPPPTGSGSGPGLLVTGPGDISSAQSRELAPTASTSDGTFVNKYDSMIQNKDEKIHHLNTTPRPTTLSFLAPLCAILRLPLVMFQQLEIDIPAVYMANGAGERGPPPSPSSAEHVLLAIFLADLSLLDYHMLRFAPFTIATAIVCMTRMTMHHYATGQLIRYYCYHYRYYDGMSLKIIIDGVETAAEDCTSPGTTAIWRVPLAASGSRIL